MKEASHRPVLCSPPPVRSSGPATGTQGLPRTGLDRGRLLRSWEAWVRGLSPSPTCSLPQFPPLNLHSCLGGH